MAAMLRRVGLCTRRLRIARATIEENENYDPYIVDHIKQFTQEELEEELGYNDRFMDFTDEYNKHRQQIIFAEKLRPLIAQDAFVAPCATLAGMVEVWHHASIWYRVTIKAESKMVRIGYATNIQDGTVIEEVPQPLNADHDGSVMIGNWVTVGHNCYLRACTIEDKSMVGMGSILNTGSYMEAGSILGAHSVLRPFQRIPHGQVWAGNPAKYIRDVTEEEAIRMEKSADFYFEGAKEHMDANSYLVPMELYREAAKKGYSVGYLGNQDAIDELKETREALKASIPKAKKE